MIETFISAINRYRYRMLRDYILQSIGIRFGVNWLRSSVQKDSQSCFIEGVLYSCHRLRSARNSYRIFGVHFLDGVVPDPQSKDQSIN